MYIPRINEHHRECCTRALADGSKAYGLRTASGALTACEPCREHHRAAGERQLRTAIHQEEEHMENYEPPDAYAPALAVKRAAESTPESRFAEQYTADRLRALDVEHREMDARIAAKPQPRLTAAELAACKPPNGYQLALDAMKGAR